MVPSSPKEQDSSLHGFLYSRSSGACWDETMPVPDGNVQPRLLYRSIRSSNGFVVGLLPISGSTFTRSDIDRTYRLDGTDGLKGTTRPPR